MALDTLDKLIAALPSKQQAPIQTPSMGTACVAGYWYNWAQGNTSSSVGTASAPAAFGSGGSIISNSLYGYPRFKAPTGSNKTYLYRFSINTSVPCSVALYDRLWGCSGMSGSVSTVQTIVGAPAITRSTSGLGNRAFLDTYTATGSTSVTATISYTNSDGVSGRTGKLTIPASNPAHRLLMFSLQAGDLGVLSVQSLQLSATTGTTGNIGVSIMKPLTSFLNASYANVGFNHDYLKLGLPELETGAAITMVFVSTGTTYGIWNGYFDFVQG